MCQLPCLQSTWQRRGRKQRHKEGEGWLLAQAEQPAPAPDETEVLELPPPVFSGVESQLSAHHGHSSRRQALGIH